MQELTQLYIYTSWIPSHKWDVGDDGLVAYRDSRIPPSEVPLRFIIDYPMFNIIRAEVCQRINVEGGERPYAWIDVERFV